MTSVARNTHMPSSDASRRSSVLSNWLVVIGGPRDAGLMLEVVLRRRRARLPFKAARAPRIRARARAKEERPPEVAKRQQVAQREHGGAGRGEEVEQRELRRGFVIAPRHSEPAEEGLREERQVEAEEDGERRDAPEDLRVHAP